MKPGTFILKADKPGYESKQDTYEIGEGATGRSFTLAPNEATRAKFGVDLRTAMFTALGGDSGRKDIRQFSGKGKLTSFDRDGGATTWTLNAVFRADGATLDATGTIADWALGLDCKGEACAPRLPKKSKLPPDQAQNLQISLESLNEYRLARMVDLITAAGTSVSAMSAQLPPQGEQQFQVRAADGASYDVVLDWQARPVSITLGSRSGLGDGLRLSFDKYAPVKTGQLPQNIDVKLPNGKQGVRLQFTELKPVP